MKLVKESLDEKEKKDTVIVKTSNPDQLNKILDCIKRIGNTGHGFSIVVDPDDGDHGIIDDYREKDKRSFYWDGDGSDHIDEITIE